MGKLKERVIEVLEIAENLSNDFDIGYRDFQYEDIEYIAMEAQLSIKDVCSILDIEVPDQFDPVGA